MKSKELSRQLTRLRSLISKIQEFTGGDFEAQAHWAKYICVLSAGFLENALPTVYGKYCIQRSHPNVARSTQRALARIRNPKANVFLEVADSFSKNWRVNLEQFLDEDGRKEAINSIMSNRHLIAHGKDSNISLTRVKDYLAKSVTVIEFIENQCNL